MYNYPIPSKKKGWYSCLLIKLFLYGYHTDWEVWKDALKFFTYLK